MLNNYSINLSPSDVDIIHGALINLPMNQVEATVIKIRMQAKAIQEAYEVKEERSNQAQQIALIKTTELNAREEGLNKREERLHLRTKRADKKKGGK